MVVLRLPQRGRSDIAWISPYFSLYSSAFFRVEIIEFSFFPLNWHSQNKGARGRWSEMRNKRRKALETSPALKTLTNFSMKKCVAGNRGLESEALEPPHYYELSLLLSISCLLSLSLTLSSWLFLSFSRDVSKEKTHLDPDVGSAEKFFFGVWRWLPWYFRLFCHRNLSARYL